MFINASSLCFVVVHWCFLIMFFWCFLGFHTIISPLHFSLQVCSFEISSFLFNCTVKGFFLKKILEFLFLKCHFPHFVVNFFIFCCLDSTANMCFQILQIIYIYICCIMYIFCHVQEKEHTCTFSP
jgi:hypothetical protein